MSRPVTHDSILFGATRIHYRIKRSRERCTLGITVVQGQVVAVVPVGMRASAIRPWIERKAAWIVAKMDEDRGMRNQWPRRLVSGEAIFYLGRQFALKVCRISRIGKGNLKLSAGCFHLSLPDNLDGDELLYLGRGIFRQWYCDHLLPRVRIASAYYAKALNIEPPKCQVRELGWRWGSCHPQKSLYFHWQLAVAAPKVVDFVVAHEVCHLVHPRHDAAFYRTLGRLVPNWQILEEQLCQVGVV